MKATNMKNMSYSINDSEQSEDPASFDSSKCSAKKTALHLQRGEEQERTNQHNANNNNNDTKKSQRKNKKHVTFAKKVQVRKTMSRKFFTDEEKLACWYTPQERTKILFQMCKQVQMLEAGKTLKDNKYCSRGLERKTQQQRNTSLALIKQCVTAVWEEQSQQWKQGVENQDLIANIYSKLTIESQKQAQIVGERDAAYVRSYIVA